MTIVRLSDRSSILQKYAPQKWFSTVSENASAAAQLPRKHGLVFNKVVRASSNSRIADTLNKLVVRGNEVKKVDIIDLSNYFRNHKKFHGALQLYKWMDGSKLEESNSDQAIRIELLYKSEGVASAELYFNSLQESEKTLKTYGALLSCYCRERVLDKAVEIFEKMKVLNYTTTLGCNNALSLYYNMGQPKKALSLVQEMEEKNIGFNIYTYNLLIKSYAALKDVDAIEKVVRKMESSNTRPDFFTYENIATVYINSGLHDKAKAVLQLMEKMKIQHHEGVLRAFRTRIKLYKMMNDLSGVSRAWEALRSAFPSPSNTDYLVMLLALSKMGNKEKLEKIFKEWEEGCSTYDFRLPSVLLEYYVSRNMIKEATSLYGSMENKQTKSSLRTLNLFMHLCIKNRQIDLALKYLEMGFDKAKLHNCKCFPSDKTKRLFLNYLEANNDMDSAVKFTESMKKHGCMD